MSFWVVFMASFNLRSHLPILSAVVPRTFTNLEISKAFCVDVYVYESAIIFLCWTFKVRVMSWLMNFLWRKKRRSEERKEKEKRFKVQTLALNIINRINFTCWWIFLHDIKNFIKLIFFFLFQSRINLVVDHKLRLFNDLEI